MAAPAVIELSTAVFAITAPIATLPVFVGLTAGQSARQQRQTAVVATITFVAVAVAAIFRSRLRRRAVRRRAPFRPWWR